MLLTVWLTDGAARDLEDLYRHIALRDSPEKADHVLQSIERSTSSHTASSTESRTTPCTS